jgi:hypothetical protein
LKTPLTGAGLALVAGLLAGAVMKPDLAGGDRPAGPPADPSWSDDHANAASDTAALARYAGKVPDYVIGTDWTNPGQATPALTRVRLPPDPPSRSYYDPPAMPDLQAPAVSAAEPAEAAYAQEAAADAAAVAPAPPPREPPLQAAPDGDSQR